MKTLPLLPRAAKNGVKRLVRKMGYSLAPLPDPNAIPQDLDERFKLLARRMHNLGPLEMPQHTTYAAVEYILNAGLAGDLIECGVYQGRQILMMAETLKARGVLDRDIYLYDTFAGQIQPTVEDYKDNENPTASYEANLARWKKGQITGASRAWKVATVEEVQRNVFLSGYPPERFHFIKGDVLSTLPNHLHDRIALLRLDTDWYESTKQELTHLYDRLVVGGVLIIDDYGRWRGCRKAVDEYFASLGARAPFLVRTSGSERVSVKVV
jgi:O-methyltransferase